MRPIFVYIFFAGGLVSTSSKNFSYILLHLFFQSIIFYAKSAKIPKITAQFVHYLDFKNIISDANFNCSQNFPQLSS